MKGATFILAMGLGAGLHAQTTITLDLSSGTGQDLYISNYPGWEDLNLNPDPDFAAIAWTGGGQPYTGRSMVEFDLGAIPPDANILDARLDLYGNPAPEHSPGHSTLSGSNNAVLQRITSVWNENTTTWNTQPTTTALNAVPLPASSSAMQDYPGLDVTALVQDMHADPVNSHGFMLRLANEQYYRALNFASGNCTVVSKRPRLTVTYTEGNCVTIPIDQGSGQDLYISDYPGWENLNLDPDPDFAAIAWTGGGQPYTGRSLAAFDLSSIPTNATITSASLDLFGNPAPEHSPGHSTLSGPNDAVLRRITSSWSANTTTWNTQPSSTSLNQVLLPPSTTAAQDYLGLDVTALVQDMYADPANSHGFLLRLMNEQYYRALNFASGNCADITKRPALEVCYLVQIGVEEATKEGPGFVLAPNPARDRVIIDRGPGTVERASLEVLDGLGRVRLKIANLGAKDVIDVSSFAQGPYLVRLVSKAGITTRRLLVQ